MKKNIKAYTIVLLFVLTTISCGTKSNESSNKETPNAYEMMETAFDGYPNKNEISPMMESVLTRYEIDVNETNLLKVGSMLVSLRKASDVGITEMDILEHIYNFGTSEVSLADQAGISTVLLENNKSPQH